MGKMKTFINLLKKGQTKQIKQSLVYNFSKMKISRILSDKAMLKLQYKSIFHKKLDLKNPKTFNEKLQWLKLYDRKPEYTMMVDKYEVKKYIAETIGEEYVIPTLGVWDRFEDIDFDKLPNQFVLKCTHDSGSVIICDNKANFDISSAKRKIEFKLKSNLFWHGREWVYKKLKPRIICEQMLIAENLENINDYKFFCFNGKVKFFKVDFDRFVNHHANYYLPNGELLPFDEIMCPRDVEREFDLPNNLSKMVELAEKISMNHYFLRVDFYETNNKIYFGEITFYPASGFGKFHPEEWDKKIGDFLKL